MIDSKKKKLDSIEAGGFKRGFSLAKTYLGGATRTFASAVSTSLLPKPERDAERFRLLMTELENLAQKMGELKGTVMKVGQMFSIYGEQFLPPEANRILRTLQSESSPMSWKAVLPTLETELGDKLKLLEIDQDPIGAASLGQVHRARVIESGKLMAIKIQYPGVEKAIGADLTIMRRLLLVLGAVPKGPKFDAIFLEIETMLKQELDYCQELAELKSTREKLVNESQFVLPEPFPEFSSRHILAMSYEPGWGLDSLDVASLSQEERNELGKGFLGLFFKELFEWGVVQTDPHFGNYRVRKDEDSGKLQIVLYDYGAVRALGPEFRSAFYDMMGGTVLGQSDRVHLGASGMGYSEAGDTSQMKELYWRLCRLVAEPFLFGEADVSNTFFSVDGEYDFAKSDLPKRIAILGTEMAIKFKLRAPPPEVVFLDRKMAGTFVVLSHLRAKFAPRSMIKKFIF